ncbi:MAG: hypothetical protein H0U76_19435 [Ktedonobacteraceae bacterium]|nr:hypothetical protein [Ktedonobacteraceae bacterium]
MRIATRQQARAPPLSSVGESSGVALTRWGRGGRCLAGPRRDGRTRRGRSFIQDSFGAS